MNYDCGITVLWNFCSFGEDEIAFAIWFVRCLTPTPLQRRGALKIPPFPHSPIPPFSLFPSFLRFAQTVDNSGKMLKAVVCKSCSYEDIFVPNCMFQRNHWKSVIRNIRQEKLTTRNQRSWAFSVSSRRK